ncbi:unnamed protein product [Arctia plantaginis]|uniref:Uncharacterized protein n=1 Tax=Arctia plantaginis TaxID=874455 RepID=A0A8S1A186_ARCPL|nr:unnamed protein product [Arctia plantaginis]
MANTSNSDDEDATILDEESVSKVTIEPAGTPESIPDQEATPGHHDSPLDRAVRNFKPTNIKALIEEIIIQYQKPHAMLTIMVQSSQRSRNDSCACIKIRRNKKKF